ncbi:MAG: diphthine synthase [Candidatus Nanopusillus sp.]
MFILSGLGQNKDEIPYGLIEEIKSADLIFLEYYTNFIDEETKEFLLNIRKDINIVDRNFVELELEKIILNNKDKKIILITSGNPLFATTHMYFIELCKKNNIEFKIINSSSIFDEIGKIGLFLYKFGRTVSISFHESTEFYDYIIRNYKNNLHTLVLLDLDPINNKYLDHKEAIKRLLEIDNKREKIFNENFKLIVCSNLNRKNEKIYYKEIKELLNINLDPPLCIIIPSNLNKIELEFLLCMIS